MKKEEENISLREYFDNKFVELRTYIDLKFKSMDEANYLARENLNTRLESMNEFRDSLEDQTSHYITRTEHDALISKYDAEVRILRDTDARAEGKASQNSVVVAYLIAISGIIIGVIGLMTQHL